VVLSFIKVGIKFFFSKLVSLNQKNNVKKNIQCSPSKSITPSNTLKDKSIHTHKSKAAKIEIIPRRELTRDQLKELYQKVLSSGPADHSTREIFDFRVSEKDLEGKLHRYFFTFSYIFPYLAYLEIS